MVYQNDSNYMSLISIINKYIDIIYASIKFLDIYDTYKRHKDAINYKVIKKVLHLKVR